MTILFRLLAIDHDVRLLGIPAIDLADFISKVKPFNIRFFPICVT